MVSGSSARSQAKSTQSNQSGKMKKMAEKTSALEREAAAKEMKEKDESMSEMRAKLAAMEDYLMIMKVSVHYSGLDWNRRSFQRRACLKLS